MTISILLVEDQAMVREGFSSLIALQQKMKITAEVSDGRTAVELTQTLKPNIVLMDIGIPELNGIDACRMITSQQLPTRVIALSIHSSNDKVIEMLRAGAMGYVLKFAPFKEVVEAIETVMAGNRYLSPSIANVVISEALNNNMHQRSSIFSVLTAREREIMQLFAEGKTTKEIAFFLEISGRTVDAHRKKVMEKLNLNTLADLTRYAVSEGLVF